MAPVPRAARPATPRKSKSTSTSKPAVKPAAKADAAAGKASKPKAKAKPAADVDAAKPKKVKPVRDSFTMPKGEYAVLQELKLRAATLGRPAKKSEVLRAGVQALAAMGDAAFLAAVGAVPAIKTGRPART
jgi:hypothetical protein